MFFYCLTLDSRQACIIIVLSGALLAGSVNVGMFIAFRFVLGFGSFMLLSAIPTMMAEIVPARLRGGLVYIHGCMVCLGYTTANWVGFGFFHWRSGALNTWRPPVAITCFLPLVLLIGLPFMPESPRWLCMQDRQDEAEAILLRLHADPNDPTDGLARVEFYQIQQQVRIDRTLGSSWMHILKTPSYRKRALLAFGTNAIIQCSGVLVINSYSTILYASLGYDPSKQLLLLALWTSVSLGLTIIGALVIDKFPRNKFMAIGMMGCISTLIVEAALVAQFVPSNNGTALRAAVAMFFVFQVCPLRFVFLHHLQRTPKKGLAMRHCFESKRVINSGILTVFRLYLRGGNSICLHRRNISDSSPRQRHEHWDSFPCPRKRHVGASRSNCV